MDDRTVPTTDEAKRLTETMRKREYRAGKRDEFFELLVESRPSHCKECEPPGLRDKVNKSQYLSIVLCHWAYINETPQKDLAHQPTYTTLLTHPITRKQGLQWLSERIYHEACLVLPETTLYRGKVENTISQNTYVSHDIDEDGPTIAAMETIYQHTICTNFEIVARYYWENATGDAAPVPWTLIDKVDNGRFMYLHHTNARVGTNALAIAGLFIEANRAVITNCFVAKDELLPLGEGLQRPHGFSWTVYQAVTPDITLIYSRSFQYAPLSSNGRQIPLEKIGQLFGLSPHGVQHRETYIEQMRSAAEAIFVESTRMVIRHVTALLEAPSTSVEYPPKQSTRRALTHS
ncbi:hypothetical protein LEN26_016849 [Aphanomyces euteiches]|nr:hypothetical protein LEN26_016849 [Aphanomyces euteiches]